MNRAKEILLEEADKDPNFGLLTGTMPVIERAMEKFAKERCMAFIKHLSKHQYDFSVGDTLEDEAADQFYEEFKEEE